MISTYLPQFLVPLVGLSFPLIIMYSLYIYIENSSIN